MNNPIEYHEILNIPDIVQRKQYQLAIIILDSQPDLYTEFTLSNGNTILHQTTQLEESIYIAYKHPAFIDASNQYQQTPLMFAAYHGNVQLVKILIDQGANINSSDQFQFTPLLYAVKANNIYTTFYLISKGANLNVKDLQGCNILHWAAHNNSVLLQLFIQHYNMSADIIDNKGQLPIDRARSNYAYQSVKYLTRFSQDQNQKHIINKHNGCIQSLLTTIFNLIIQLIFNKHTYFMLTLGFNINILYIYYIQEQVQLIKYYIYYNLVIC